MPAGLRAQHLLCACCAVQDRSAVSPLLLVAFMGDARWAQTMLSSGVDPDAEFVDESGAVYFPLFVAAREGHEAVVEVSGVV